MLFFFYIILDKCEDIYNSSILNKRNESKFVDFTLEEYKNVTSEISTIMAEIFDLEKYSIVVFGAIYVFILIDMSEHKTEFDPKIFLALPIVTTLVFGLLIYARYLRAKLLAVYIKSRYEINFGSIGDVNIGYETFLSNELKSRNSAIFITRVVSWAIQLGLSIFIFWYV